MAIVPFGTTTVLDARLIIRQFPWPDAVEHDSASPTLVAVEVAATVTELISVEEKLRTHWMPVGCVPLAWKFRFKATLPPGAPDPEASPSEGPCANALSSAATVAHSRKSLLKIS